MLPLIKKTLPLFLCINIYQASIHIYFRLGVLAPGLLPRQQGHRDRGGLDRGHHGQVIGAQGATGVDTSLNDETHFPFQIKGCFLIARQQIFPADPGGAPANC